MIMCEIVREYLKNKENFHSFVLPVFSLCLKQGGRQLTGGLNLVAAHSSVVKRKSKV